MAIDKHQRSGMCHQDNIKKAARPIMHHLEWKTDTSARESAQRKGDSQIFIIVQ